MNIYFTSGQVSKLFNISKQTLIFYDKIGLIKPDHIDPNTLYRYYSIEQFFYLYLILALKTSGIELKNIHNYLNEHSIPTTIDLLSSQIRTLNHKIAELETAKNTLDQTLKQIEYGIRLKENNPYYFKYFEEQYLYTFPIDKTDITKDFSLTFSKLANKYIGDYSTMKWNYGCIVSLKPTGEFNNRELFIVLDKPDHTLPLIKRPSGEYLCTFHKGKYDTISETIQKLLDYAEQNCFTILGYVYEHQLINSFMTDDCNEFITEISIGVE
ncbi:DNA-binding transcriptional MerR regulator [Lachnotalea glycerini]|jgi:DNA-binding transcriptional MerR regulator/effector-binding domain-containing protein|uniref:DNA-binding transcriptional MerR regulator n=1 Tax=Lachnotalea glycerini TaxID=1763509 RepID=A0A255IAC5_9FIRM|nr:MerR family DNA-binding transcriptional regulator [Lachnotalea glycerini]PXV85718.1 DNA-binding transcriptional MerR regulator [Lachnotalea glycerini]RDY30705.1 MerR family transcriptional regulator [Lachnotalea glycerini]